MVRGVGTDIVEIDRLRRLATRFPGRFLKKVFTTGELAYCSQRRDPFPCYAARFAAKEAVLKALGTGLAQGYNWQEVEVVARAGRAPHISLHGKVAVMAMEKGISKVLLSLSHDQTRALAFALVLGG